MRRLLALGTALLGLGTLLALAPAPGVARAATANVSVEDNAFAPVNITVNVGDTVEWTWAGANPHSVTADDGSFDSNPPPANFQTSGSFSHTFTAPGTYRYYCRVHGAPNGVGMSGTITVQAPAPTATATAVAPTVTAAAPTATNTAAPTTTGTPAPTSTSSPTPVASSTMTAVATASATTAPSGTPASVLAAPSRPAGGAAAGAALPTAGDGASAGGGASALRWILVLAAGGTLALAVTARRARRR